ncbi:TPA: FG-GAP repeat protein [Salmonella enterica subsp. enterica serovar Vietnam]|nr:FG-GAP repeat protein [Salmonella enterica]
MGKVSLLLAVCVLPLFCSASDAVNAEYSIFSMYSGTIGKSNITMNLVTSGNRISGSYIYDKYKNKILLNGVVNSNSVELKEKTNNSTAAITLVHIGKGYTGKWCDKKCVPVTIQTNNTFKDGGLKYIKVDDSDAVLYKINLVFKNKNEEIIISDAIDPPSLEFVDINGDGFYDLVVRTDHRPNNGSQTVYISGNNGFIEDKDLSKENGTFVYNPYKKNIVFNLKDDCCNTFNKVIYYFYNGKAERVDNMFFDYSSNEGKDSKGGDISKDKFESY